MESTFILHRTTESERGLMVGGIYNDLTIENKHMNLSFFSSEIRIGELPMAKKITIRILEDKLVRFLVEESQSQSSSVVIYLSSNLRPETTHTSNWQHQNTVRQIQNSDLGKCKIATHCAVWPG